MLLAMVGLWMVGAEAKDCQWDAHLVKWGVVLSYWEVGEYLGVKWVGVW